MRCVLSIVACSGLLAAAGDPEIGPATGDPLPGIALAAVCAGRTAEYNVIDLGQLPPWISSSAQDINSVGMVVGHATVDEEFSWHAILWTDGSVTDLGTLGGRHGLATGINDAGLVVGYGWRTSGPPFRAALWQIGTVQDLGTLGGTMSTAWAINNLGQIVGVSRLESQQNRAFLWENGVMQNLGVLHGATTSWAFDINDRGQIVGRSRIVGAGLRGFLWQDGRMTELGTLGGDSSWAFSINETGEIVGSSLTGEIVNGDNEVKHAAMWQNGQIVDLGTLGGYDAEASDIDNLGRVVGHSTDADFQINAFLWRKGDMLNLNDLIPPDTGWTLWYANVINDAGQIAGTGTFGGSFRAFLLNPVVLGDLDGDGVVGRRDLKLLLGAWGLCPDCVNCLADLDGDCAVAVPDLLTLLANWGP